MMFDKLIPFLKGLYKDDTSYLTKYGDTSTISDKGVIEELKLTKLIHNLTVNKPLGHCIARALQLLRSVPMKGMESESNICKAKFLETKTGLTRSGIPEPGSTLDTSPGLSALTKLFYDGIQYGSPKVYMESKTLPKYIEFMKHLSIIYGDYDPKSPKSDSDIEKYGLSGIRNKRDNELCRGKPESIKLTNEQATNVYTIVNELYKRQLKHNANAGSIFNMLFKIETNRSSDYLGPVKISFSDNILKKGIPEINRINSLTRDILIDYYKNCELTYLQGVKYILSSTSPKPPTTPAMQPIPPVIPGSTTTTTTPTTT
jgi:hypothetical protein